jgi:hypothetical protein
MSRGRRRSTLVVYLQAQAMMLVFGIVGPIFLVIYFSIPPDPTMKWMYFAGLLVTAGDVLVALWLTHVAVSADGPGAADAD